MFNTPNVFQFHAAKCEENNLQFIQAKCCHFKKSFNEDLHTTLKGRLMVTGDLTSQVVNF